MIALRYEQVVVKQGATEHRRACIDVGRIRLLFCSLWIAVISSASAQSACAWYLPINVSNRQSWEQVRLTKIGEFGLVRKARPGIPAHYHTATDFMRPGDNYENEPIFPAAAGRVISQRDDGPFAQLIVEHVTHDHDTLWTVYEHIADLTVVVGDTVDPFVPIGRFMTKKELSKYGWQFDHVHFEIMKHRPRPLQPTKKTPMRLFKVYNLECYTKAELEKYYYAPHEFFQACWNMASR
ncbi:M23 family metallopeptidase [candidate division KSB1 bacterium]|nr:M23 family metallopeptidase [candidate division KSB1 bacterium]